MAAIVSVLWGTLFPMIKIEYKVFEIDNGEVASIFSAILLGENIFKITYIIATVFIVIAIAVSNFQKDKRGN